MNKETKQHTKNSKKRVFLISAVIIITLILGILYYFYKVLVLEKYETTDNSYVNGNIVTVSSEIKGTVKAVYVNDTKNVKEGEILVKLNDQDAEIALEKAKATLGSTARQLKEKYTNVGQYKAILQQKQIALQQAEKDYYRRKPLAAKRIISQEQLAHAKNAMLLAKEDFNVVVEQQKIALSGIEGVTLENHPKLLEAKSSFIESWLNLKRTTIVAPISGYIAKKNVQIGNLVNPGTPLLAIVPLDQLWIEANLKENQLKNIRINQNVTITTDVYGKDIIFHGKVVGLSAGTGSAFSLLPAQNATGNWIKIIQRVPVRISLDKNELQEHPLRIGLSANIKIETSNRSGTVLYKLSQNNQSNITTVFTQDLQEAERIANEIIAKNTQINKKITKLNRNNNSNR